MNTDKHNTAPRKNRKKYLLFLIPALLLFLLLLLLFLPVILEQCSNRIMRNMLAEAHLDFDIREIGLAHSNFNIGAWVSGRPDSPRLRMDLGDVTIRYSPSRLAGGSLDSIQIANVNLPVSWKNGTLDLPVLPLFRPAEPSAKQPVAQRKDPNAPFFAMPIQLRKAGLSGTLILSIQDELMIVPFSLNLEFDGANNKRDSAVYTLQIMIPGNNPVQARGKIDLNTGELYLNTAGRIRLESLPYAVRMLISRDPALKGELIHESNSLFDLKNKTIKQFHANLQMNAVQYPPFSGSGVWRVDLAEDRALVMEYNGDLGVVTAGLPLTLRQMRIRHEPGRDFTLTGDAVLRAGNTEDGEFPAKFSFRRNEKGVPELLLNPFRRHTSPRNFTFGTMEIHLPAWEEKQGQLRLSFGQKAELHGMLEVPLLQIRRQTLSADLKNVMVSVNGPFSNLRLQASFSEMDAKNGQQQLLSLKKFTLNTFLNGQQQGTFEIPEMSVMQKIPGKIAGTLDIKPDDFSIRLRAGTDLLGFHSDLNVFFQPREAALDLAWNLPEQSLAEPLDLSIVLPELNFMIRSMKLKASAGYRLTPKDQSGSARIQVDGFNLDSEKYKIKLTDASLRFALPNLPELKSAPGAAFRFKALEYDKIQMDTGRIAFRMDSPDVWQLESALFNWCGGKIRLGALRIAPKTERFFATLYCDRVRLGKLLAQFGVGTDAGDNAELNGTIPLSIRNGSIQFRNGFLYSTPGETGILRLVPNATVGAMGASSVEMSFALDALKDFHYQWVKITLSSEKEEMLLKFQLDGKPANPLHYTIDKDTGRPVKTQGTNRFQGIPLEINLRLPLQKSLELYQSFNKLWSEQK